MNATQEVLHTLNRYVASGRRLPFAICLDARARQSIIDLMSSIHYRAQPAPTWELRLCGVLIGTVR